MNCASLVSTLLLVNLLVASAGVAIAEPAPTAQPSPPAQTAKAPVAVGEDKPATVSVPKHKCERPEMPTKFETEAQQQAFVKQMDGYRDCLMAYRNEMNKLAQAHIAAANGAIDEFNAFVKAVNSK